MGKSTRDRMDQCRVLQENRPQNHCLLAIRGSHVITHQDRASSRCGCTAVRWKTCARRAAPFSQTGGDYLKQPRIVVLDLSGMETVDGGGLGVLVFLHRWTRENAIQLKLVNPSSFVRHVLECTRLTRVLNISSMDDAVEILASSESTIEHRNWAAA